MEPTTFVDDAEFWLPTEFLTDDDFRVEKENNGCVIDGSFFPYEPRHGFVSNSGFGSTVKPKSYEDDILAGLTKQMVQLTVEDDFSGGFCGNHAFPAGNDYKACVTARSPQSTLCGTGGYWNHNCQSRVSSQTAWDMYCAAAEEAARMNITNESYDCHNLSGRELLHLPRKHSVSAAKNPNNRAGYFNHQSLQYQKLQAIQFQQLKQQQLLKNHRQLVQRNRGVSVNSNKNGGPVALSSSAWSYQLLRRDNSGMRAVFLGDQPGKRSSTGTGVFLPRRVNHNSPATAETREKHTLTKVLVPARVAQVLNRNLNESSVQPIVRSSGNLNGVQRSNNGGFSSQTHGGGGGGGGGGVKAEQPVNDPRLPSDWAY